MLNQNISREMVANLDEGGLAVVLEIYGEEMVEVEAAVTGGIRSWTCWGLRERTRMGGFCEQRSFLPFMAEKMEAAVVAMEGDALRWYQWENKRNSIVSWEALKEFILLQFRPTNGGSLYEQWLATNQTTTVQDYRRKFIDMAAPLDSIPEAIRLGKFICGLKEEIQTEMRVLSPLNLAQAMDLALKMEEKNKVIGLRKVNGPGSHRTGYSLYNKNPTLSS